MVQTSPSLSPGQYVAFPASIWCPRQPFTAPAWRVGLQSIFSFCKNVRLCCLSMSLSTTWVQVKLLSFCETLGFSFCPWVELCISPLYHVSGFSFLFSNSSRYVIKLLIWVGGGLVWCFTLDFYVLVAEVGRPFRDRWVCRGDLSAPESSDRVRVRERYKGYVKMFGWGLRMWSSICPW